MTNTGMTIEEKVTAAFDKQAPEFDRLYGEDRIIHYKRKRVREQVEHWLAPRSFILELNAGTGEDAVYFARQGHHVHATDISGGMQEELTRKVRENNLTDTVSFERCSFTELEHLAQQGPYDLIFSNFAGLNCTSQLKKVLSSFSFLVKPGGFVTLVILPRFCLWEFLLLFRGKFKTAFRRFSGNRGTTAKIDGEHFRCWYYNPSYIRKQVKGSFDIVAQEGLCTLVPPSYMSHFAEKHPTLFSFLKKKEDRWKNKWPWRSVGDYYIITLQKKQ
ncbi:MAG: class I SAM-dependent methyltransferase [Bacteroidota bacterium]